MTHPHETSASSQFVIQYPIGQTPAADGTMINNSLIALEVLKTMEAGGGAAFPIDVDCDGHVVYAWQIHLQEPDAWEVTRYTPR